MFLFNLIVWLSVFNQNAQDSTKSKDFKGMAVDEMEHPLKHKIDKLTNKRMKH